jgi:hypothetical protein
MCVQVFENGKHTAVYDFQVENARQGFQPF